MLWWSAVAVAAVAGLVLRVLAARGGLWTDEAWSMIYADQAQDAVGVFLRINHDNNHHLNTLWLQAIGIGAPPWLARLPAIFAGTACVVVAAVLAGDKSRAAGLVAVLLFAISPALVTLGSEARGYALMLLAVLTILLIATRAVERGWSTATPWWLALVAVLGMLSHLTMAAPVALIALWVYLDQRGSVDALRTTARLMGPAVIASIAVAAFVLIAALSSPTGMRVGGYAPFVLGEYRMALDQLSGWAIGLEWIPWSLRLLAVGIGAGAIALRPPQWLGSRGRVYAILVLGVPVAALLLRPGNASFARYYVTSLIGLLLLITAIAGNALDRRGPIRWVAVAALLAFAGLNLAADADVMRLQRGRPDGPIAEIAKLSPSGARVAVDRRYEAIVTVAAARARYPVQFAKGCERAGFLLVPQPRQGATPVRVVHCGLPMRELDSSATSPMTGDAWVLYGAEALQTNGPPVSGPPPGGNRRLSGRAGVAQG